MSTELVNVATGEVIESESPEQFLAHAREMAVMLDDVVRKQKLDVDIQGKRYLRVEAWQFLAGMAQMTPRTRDIETLRDEINKPIGVRVYVELVRDMDGLVLGGAFGRCDYGERIGKSGAFAAESMAQTRATAKAISQKLRFVPVLAGYQGTPMEEMPPMEKVPPPPKWVKKPEADAHVDAAMDEAFDTVAIKVQPEEVSPKFGEAVSTSTATLSPSDGRADGGGKKPPASSGSRPSWIMDRLPKIQSRPNWFGRDWEWMTQGAQGGDRHGWANAVIDNKDAPKTLKLRCEYVVMAIEGKA